jgi:hypothetical protein
MQKLRYAKSKPKKNLKYFMPAIVALVLILIGGGAILAAVNIHRGGTATHSTGMTVSGSGTETQTLYDETPITISYLVTNTSDKAYTVTATPLATPSALIITPNTVTTFSLNAGANQTVSYTLQFTDTTTPSGTYSVDFTHT